MRWVTGLHHVEICQEVFLCHSRKKLAHRIMRHTLLRSPSFASLYEEYDKLYDG